MLLKSLNKPLIFKIVLIIGFFLVVVFVTRPIIEKSLSLQQEKEQKEVERLSKLSLDELVKKMEEITYQSCLGVVNELKGGIGCEIFRKTTDRDGCYFCFAITKKDKLFCNKITEGTSLRKRCEKEFLVIEEMEWETYRNEEYGFEINYPRDFFFTASKGTQDPEVFWVEFASKEWENQKVHNPAVYITIIKTELSPKQWLDKYGTEKSIFDESLPLPKCISEPGGCLYFGVKDIKDVFMGINKISALQFYNSAVSGSDDNTLIKDTRKNILIEISRHSSGMGEMSKDIYNQMLSSFKF